MERNNYTLDFSEQVFHVTTNTGVRFEIRVSIKDTNDSSFYNITIFDKDKELNRLDYRISCKKFTFFDKMISNIIATFEDIYSYV